jgi:hypothetical protein
MSEIDDSTRIYPQTVLLDSSALLALGAGNQWLSRLLGAAAGRDLKVFTTALCLTAAVAERPLLADHIGGLAPIAVLDLTYSSASVSGTLIANGINWRHAQAVADARPSLEWPDGLTIVTTEPQAYTAHKEVRVHHLN